MAQIYNANPNLKAIGVEVNYTPEQIQEYIKCKTDYIYFIETYCQIVTLDRGLQPFKLYDCQKRKLKIIHENRKVILMEGRQQGKTTTSAAYILWYTIFQDAKNVAILANKATAAREVLARYQVMFECLPIWLQQGVKSWNKGDIELENGSKVFTAATSASGIRGKSVNLLYVDEAAIIPNTVAEQFFASVYPTISAGETTKILLSSTPLGYNHFWKFWNDAENKRNGFVNLFIPYWEIPGRDKKWADEQRGILGDLKFNQEVLCKFLGSALTLINSDVIGNMSPSYPMYSKDGLDVYEEPVYETETEEYDDFGKPKFKPPHSYVLIADVGAGVDGDYSAFSVIDITTAPYKQVAKFRKNDVSPLLYPNFIYKVAKEYNNAYILIEINISEQVANILHNELEYENLLFVNRNAQGQTISGGFGGGRTQLGVTTDRKVKRIGCMNFKSMVEEQKLLIPDADTISEITTFIESKGSYAADDGYNDDLVMTLVLFGWLTTQPYFKDLNDINLRELIYKTRIKAIENELTPFGFIADGQGSEERPLLNF
jgi:Terminase RNaseH-like domain/Terminase large subunit, T4likevirus-type, N-terminal